MILFALRRFLGFAATLLVAALVISIINGIFGLILRPQKKAARG